VKSQFETYCNELGLESGNTYLLALSGGADSVCLFHLLRDIGIKFTVVHCNYQLRGDESDLDEGFVKELCENYNVPLVVKRFDTNTLLKTRKGNIQEVARDLRYELFLSLCEMHGFHGILTAHHLNDSIETSLFNFARGTDLRGLSGVPIVNGSIYRPLSPFTKKEILRYLGKNDFAFRQDSSNFKPDYSRNKIRLNIMPQFEEIFEDAEIRFRNSLENIRLADQFITNQIDELRIELFQEFLYGKEVTIKDLENLKPRNWVLSKLFAPFGFRSGDEINKLMNANTGKKILSKDFRLIKNRKHLILTNHPSEQLSFTISGKNGEFGDPLGLTWEIIDKDQKCENFDVEFDCDTFDLPLTIRTWQKGDYFYPLGMNGKKKISDFFSDQKMSLPEKENTWLLCSGGQILYVIGHRQDSRFVVSDRTKTKMGIKLNTHDKF